MGGRPAAYVLGMDVIEVRPQLHMFRFPVGQAYLWHDDDVLTLVDSGPVGAAEEIELGIRGLGLDPAGLSRIVLTHAHEDHTGSAGVLAERWGARIAAHRLEAPVIRGERPVPPPVLLDWELPVWENTRGLPPAPPTRVDDEVEDGTALDFGDGARVVHVPGHTPGSVALHLPRHGVLFTGDAVAAAERVMLGVFNVDREQAKAALRRLSVLGPSALCFGHGAPVTENAAAALLTAAELDAEL